MTALMMMLMIQKEDEDSDWRMIGWDICWLMVLTVLNTNN